MIGQKSSTKYVQFVSRKKKLKVAQHKQQGKNKTKY